MKQIFFSYSHADTAIVHRLVDDLMRFGANIWIDKRILSGKAWDDEIKTALDQSQIMLLFVSEASNKSKNVKNEYGYFIDQGKLVIPVLLEAVELPLRVRDFQAILRQPDYDSLFRTIYAELKNHDVHLSELPTNWKSSTPINFPRPQLEPKIPIVIWIALALLVTIGLGTGVLLAIGRNPPAPNATLTPISQLSLAASPEPTTISMPVASPYAPNPTLSIPTVYPSAVPQSSQTPDNMTLTRNASAFVFFLSQNLGEVSLKGLKINVASRRTIDFAPFFAGLGLDETKLKAPICIRLLKEGEGATYPTECQNLKSTQRYSLTVSESDVFWYDPENNRPYSLTLQIPEQAPFVCPLNLPNCSFALILAPH